MLIIFYKTYFNFFTQNGSQEVFYSMEGGWGALTIDSVGGIRSWTSLDREIEGGSVGIAHVIAKDNGDPSLTSTATLTITVTDVNDCPPRILPPTLFHVTEGSSTTLLGVLVATDDDVWALGHGPPFMLSLAQSNPPHIPKHIELKYNPSKFFKIFLFQTVFFEKIFLNFKFKTSKTIILFQQNM